MTGKIGDLFNEPAAKVRRRPKWRLEGLDGVQPLTPDELEGLVPVLPPFIARSWRSAIPVSRLPLSFYPGYELCEVRSHRTHARGTFWLLNGRRLTELDGTNQPFYILNPVIPIQLTDENVLFYVRVFFRFVRGRHGDFHFMESLDDVPGLHELDPEKRGSIQKHVAPLRIRTSSERDGWTVDACVLFKNTLFSAPIDVALDGTVEMGESTLLMDGISWDSA